MKKLWANVLVLMMILPIFSFYSGSSNGIIAAEANKEGAVIAPKVHLIGQDEAGNPCDEVPWKKTPDQVWWGRNGFMMPNCQLAKDSTNTINIPATEENGFYTRPVFWARFYLHVVSANGKSTESDPWYVVIDDAGQAWFDPDGVFHDPRYYARADIGDQTNYVSGSCISNPNTQVDNIPGNNTQGPYIIDPSYQYNEASPTPTYQQNVFFWDNRRTGGATKRFFKFGWIDMVDFEVNSYVGTSDWDIGLDLIHFYDPNPTVVEPNDEFHTDLSATFTGRTTFPNQYDDGEFIYRKGSGNFNQFVEIGDLRESWIVVTDSYNEPVTYQPLTFVGTNDLDQDLPLVPFIGNETETLQVGHELHTDFGLTVVFYDSDEYIYRKQDANNDTILPFSVEAGDIRLTNVNTTRYTRATLSNPMLNLNVSNQNKSFDALWLGGMWAGDALLLSEVLEGGCGSPTYDVSVQTDLWMNTNPARVSARLRSQTGDILRVAQDVQKATTLSPAADQFYLPVTTFHNIKLKYREYIGVELWKDDGQNNVFRAYESMENKCTAYNLDDDYKQKYFGEEYIGAVNGSPDPDYNRTLIAFSTTEFYYDTSNDGRYGLGEGIYRKKIGNNLRVVEPGDIRATAMRYDINGHRVNFKAMTVVNQGDVDVGINLRRFTPDTLYYDETDPWNSSNPPNLKYDAWEDIYRVGAVGSLNYSVMNVPLRALITDLQYKTLYADMDNDSTVSIGDIRIFHPLYDAGSIVKIGDTDLGSGLSAQIPIGIMRMIPGDPTSPPKFAYADTPVDLMGLGRVSVGDIRLNAVNQYSAGSIVANTDSDAPYEDPPGSANWVYTAFDYLVSGLSVTSDGQVFIENNYGLAPNPNEANEDDFLITPVKTASGVRRLTEVEIAGEVYQAGTLISAGNVFKNQIKVNMMRMGANGDKRFVDIAVVPGKLGLDVKFSSPLMVERTTEVTVTVNPPLQKNEKLLVYFYDQGHFDTTQSHIDSRLLTASDPVAKVQFTPYRGSLDDSGQYGNRYFKIQAYRIEALPQGMSDNTRLIRPPDGLYVDPFWEKQMFRLGKLSIEAQLEYRYPRYLPTPRIMQYFQPLTIPPFPATYENIYDCYQEWKEPILASPIAVMPDKKCLTVYEQRQPSLAVRIYDPDDPLDVNDPSAIPISCEYGIDPLFFFNVHGGGIAWLCVIQDTASFDKYIMQVNTDNTYFLWLWDDIGYGNIYDAADGLTFLGSGGPSRWIDLDCSEGTGKANPIMNFNNSDFKFPPFGDITWGDTFAGGPIINFGVPVHVNNYSTADEGGLALIIARPINSETPVEVMIYSKETLFDYNSTIGHAPYFIRDFNQGIDYVGSAFLNVIPPDPVLNFVDVNWVDHALQYSTVNYTHGPLALSTMKVPPTPLIQSRYNPILFDWQDDIRCYPGGQTNTGRVLGKVSSDIGWNDTGRGSGWNAYPAIHSKSTARKRFANAYEKEQEWQYDQYNKLGTEFYPLTDYGLFFVLKNYNDEHYSFRETDTRLLIKQIKIKGPFATPKRLYKQQDNVTYFTQPNNLYNELKKVPLQYDFTGEIVIDMTNYYWYEQSMADFTTITSPYTVAGSIGFKDTVTYTKIKDRNPHLEYNKRLQYQLGIADANMTQSIANCFVIDEIIPINRGKIEIEVELYDGTKRKFADCCETKEEGFITHALDLQVDKTEFYPDIDQKLGVSLKEYEPKGFDPSYEPTVKECNDAVVVAWQDRGVYNPATKSYDGAGDGWITKPPRSSTKIDKSFQYDQMDDINEDGKISFADFETELLGTYDLASNTWQGGVIDGRTFNQNNGLYTFDFSHQSGNQITTVGWDFGGAEVKGNVSPADHIIDENETLPIYINAYKYGDDNNDRSFVYNVQSMDSSIITDELRPFFEFSHEVYLSAWSKIDVKPVNDLVVNVDPDPLTAGVTPELGDPQKPLTLIVLDADGSPVDLHNGVPDAAGEREIQDRELWNKLIMDPHPDNEYFYGKGAKLPQYYWLRTDLHNADDTFVSNTMLYSDGKNPFAPIEIDFRDKLEGKYTFKGFCANDQGTFDVYVFTPDRKHIGKTIVKVVLPDVTYQVVNTDDPTGNVFSTPGEPDFVMTAADNRLYRITATVKNAQGIPMKGAGNEISVCGGTATETSRFTLFTTAPYNFGWQYNQPDPENSSGSVYGISSGGDTYYYIFGGDDGADSLFHMRAGFDFNKNGTIGDLENEIFTIGGFQCYFYNPTIRTGSPYSYYGNWTYYNTRNWRWDDGKYVVLPMHLIYPEPAISLMETRWYNYGMRYRASIIKGWGLGAIYNSPHRFGYCFVDINRDKHLTYQDALNLDKEGKVTYYLFAEDVASTGGLVGNNRYSNNIYSSDLYGNPVVYTEDSPSYTQRRFINRYQLYSSYYSYLVSTGDHTFKMDWEAFPNQYLECNGPTAEMYDANTLLPLGKELLSARAYDISYGRVNHILLRAYPADKRDLPLQIGASVVLDGNEYIPSHGDGSARRAIFNPNIYGPESEKFIYGNLYECTADPKARETIIRYTPTGTGEENGFLQYYNKNARFEMPNFYMAGGVSAMDIASGLSVEVLSDNELKAKTSSKIMIYVKEAGTQYPVPGATISLEGVGVNDSKVADSEGKAVFTVTPSNRGIIIVRAKMQNMISAILAIGVEEDATPQFIDLDPVDIVIETSTVLISGLVKIGSTVTINQQPVKVDGNGKFRYEAILTERNTVFEIVAKDQAGRIAKKIVNVEKPTDNLQISVDVPEKIVEATEVSIKGKVSRKNITENSANRAIWVFVNGIEADVIPDEKFVSFDFEATIPVTYGRNRVEINVRTNDGFTKKVVEIPNYKKSVIELQIDNDIANINGQQKQIDAKPYISQGRTFVPLRVVAEGFGAQVEWVQQTKGINITMGDKVISMQIGSNRAIINNQIVTMDAAPEIKNGRTFVPIRFVSEALGAEVQWNQSSRKVIITRLTME